MAKTQYTKAALKEAIAGKLQRHFACEVKDAKKDQIYEACALVIRDALTENMIETQNEVERDGDRQVHYLCMEFLVGRAIYNNLLCLGILDSTAEELKALGVDITYNHADYRLMSARALEALSQFGEVNLFLRGLVPLVGYPSTVVYYERGKRFAGESKYPLRKMLSFAWEGVSSLTVSPLRLITRIGIVMFLVSIAMLIYFLVRYFTGHTVAGWSSLAVSIWAIGGLQLLAIGVVGEYIGKIYLETKARPRYRIETELDDREAEL